MYKLKLLLGGEKGWRVGVKKSIGMLDCYFGVFRKFSALAYESVNIDEEGLSAELLGCFRGE